MSPTSGTTSTSFTFTVTYSHVDGNAPIWVRVTINGVAGSPFDMSPAGPVDYVNGTTYAYTTTLPAGTYTYSFAARRNTTRSTNGVPPSVTVVEPTP
ncbi:MAG TPA: hypothetical protein VJZ72_04645, partial [Candidatus Limnocylindrales bacterium]|nr:hypothetical protein [Candidatus Limnocylindrales bacterium]